MPALSFFRQLGVLTLAVSAEAQSIRVIRFAEAQPFRMGEVTSNRIVHPGIGARKTTLNYSVSKPGNEFAQHVHDYSDDTILVLQGEVDLRQGETSRRFRAGECAFVPTGQIHGTVTAGTGEAIMISFQNPPDLILYTGARDSKRPGAAQPKGDITPGAVKYLDFSRKNGEFTNLAMGSQRASGSHRVLAPRTRFKTSVLADGEQFLFVWKGGLRAKDRAGNVYTAGERDTIFIQGEAQLEVTAEGYAAAHVIQVQAPAGERKR
jgi:quercetin dioxygenase-like cupin family protein